MHTNLILFKSPLSLSMVVLNSRDREEIIWLREFSHFKNQPCNRFYPKKHLECITTAIMTPAVIGALV